MPRRRTTENSTAITALSTDTRTRHSACGLRLDLSHATSKRPPPSPRGLASPLPPRHSHVESSPSRPDAAVSR
ncbi:hypothetical protein BKA81DRAFT_64298 [Phyllosticta paracitricarpa]